MIIEQNVTKEYIIEQFFGKVGWGRVSVVCIDTFKDAVTQLSNLTNRNQTFQYRIIEKEMLTTSTIVMEVG